MSQTFIKKSPCQVFVLKKCVTDLITYRQTAWASILYVNGILWEIYDHVLSHHVVQGVKNGPQVSKGWRFHLHFVTLIVIFLMMEAIEI